MDSNYLKKKYISIITLIVIFLLITLISVLNLYYSKLNKNNKNKYYESFLNINENKKITKKFNLVYLKTNYKDYDYDIFKCNNEKIWHGDVESIYIIDLLDTTNINIIQSTIYNLPSKIDILVYNSNVYKKDVINTIIDNKKPKILIYNADEFGNREHDYEMFKKVPLVYRQHIFKHYPKLRHVKTFPLGYHCWDSNYIKNIKDIKPVLQRKYIWCFMGSPKGKRKKYVDYLENYLQPYFNNITKYGENTKIFNNSMFAICPPGNYSIECFRQYAASLNGSIPILICPKHEFDFFYNTFDLKPHWISVSTPTECVNIIKFYLDNPNKMIQLQKEVIQWFPEIKLRINRQINKILNE